MNASDTYDGTPSPQIEMDADGDGAEEGLGAAAGAWTTATYQTQGLSNVVHIIVPDLTCIPQGQPNDALATAFSEVANSGGLVGHEDPGSAQGVKDSLAALAAAAELDQVRNDVAAVEHMMEETKYSHLGNSGEQQGVAVMPEDADGLHHSVVVNLPIEQEKTVTMVPLPLAPFLQPEDPDATFYNEVYHYLRSGSFPEGATDTYKKAIRKRATNYLINEEGTLSYGHKMPKEVITSAEKQRSIIELEHVDHTTGVHFGVKKMYSSIFSKYYWRTIYVDVGNYCRRCEKCTEVAVSSFRDLVPGEQGEDSLGDEINRVTTLPTDRIIRVWKKVQIKIHGPYNRTVYGNEMLLTIIDPFSKWIVAQASTEVGLEVHCARFIFDTFCQYGFAQCHVVGMTSEMFERMQACYKEKFDSAQDVLRTLVPFDSEDAQQSFLFTLQEESHECAWAGEMLDHFCNENPTTWDQEVNRYLFQFRTTATSLGGVTPFNVMFARNPTGYVSEEEKENINILEEEKALEVPAKRRRLQSSTLQSLLSPPPPFFLPFHSSSGSIPKLTLILSFPSLPGHHPLPSLLPQLLPSSLPHLFPLLPSSSAPLPPFLICSHPRQTTSSPVTCIPSASTVP
ncbi:Transposon Ty3-I Gag-Pol polyprotein [Penaeus vannamei]|uniref:Transposon Ty3-I Gag-Pol polyprotein n=1 Tax=Penaeus vannamei TaxID=6689 RepID=A0A3R7MJ07_PENVA|nr:Transposon Ty3-I Gag-Pol polyprotein [Penaeus vannamei]